MSEYRPTFSLEVDDTLRRIVVIFRILALVWMASLVAITLASDDQADVAITVTSLIVAVGQTGASVWAARNSWLHRPLFVVGDGVLSWSIGLATTLAGASELFHGGIPMSWLFVAAYAYGLRGALGASLLLAVEQIFVHIVDGRGPVGAAGSLVFVAFGVVAGQAFDALRRGEVRRVAAEHRLLAEQRARARHEERARLADRLHDSVLQSLLVMRRDAEDPQQVRYLARREVRALRRSIADLRSEHDRSFRASLLQACDEVEDLYRVNIESVVRDDPELTPELEAAVGAAREALINAAKHSGADHVDVYSDVTSSVLTIHVRDRGTGFDPGDLTAGTGVDHSLLGRVREVGGWVAIISAPGQGTEVTITVDCARG